MLSLVAPGAALGLSIPASPEGKIVLALTWMPTAIVGLVLLTALLILFVRRIPPGDSETGNAPTWFRLLVAGFSVALLQALMAGLYMLVKPDAFTHADLTMQYLPRGLVLAAALVGLLALFADYSRNSARALARGRARLAGPFKTPVIGLLTPTEEQISSACGRLMLYTSAGRRLTGLFVVALLLPVLTLVGLDVLRRQGYQLSYWPLVLPFLFCWGALLLAWLRVNVARRRLNRRSLVTYCQELATLGRRWGAAVDAELRLAGLGMYQRLADLADVLGKERLLQQGMVEAVEAVAEARLALAQAAMEPGGEGIKEATEYLVGAVELRDLRRGEWLGLGWLLASDYVPESLVRDRARYGHLLLNYCRAWVAAQRQLRQNVPLSAGVRTNARLRLVVNALERRVCSLTPLRTDEQTKLAEQGAPHLSGTLSEATGRADRSAKDAPWRTDTFLADLAARPDLQLLLTLNEAVLKLDETLPWARLNAGLCCLALGDAATARAHLEVVASQRRDDPVLVFYRAVAYAREQQSSDALALLEEATERDLGWFPAVRLYAEALIEVAQTPLVSPSLSGQAITTERWMRALALIGQALVQPALQARLQTPAAAPIYIAAGLAELFGRQQSAEANAWFRRALGVDRQQVQAWYGLALACWEQGQVEVTLDAVQEVLRVQPQHVPAMTLYAHVLMVRGEMTSALAMAEQALRLLGDPLVAQQRVLHHPRLFPEREVLLRVKGRAAFEQGRFDEAFVALDQVVQRYVDARFFAACALYHVGRYAEAAERLKDYLASKDGMQDCRAFLYLGCALHAQGKQQQRAALNALDACLQLAEPGTPEYLRGLLERGQIYEERGQLDQAQQDYEAALEIERSPLTVYVLAALYHRAGRDQEAYELLRAVVGEDERTPDTNQQLSAVDALAQASAGNTLQGGRHQTRILLQADESIETQTRRLFELLRERLAEQGKQSVNAQKAEQEQGELMPTDQPTGSDDSTPEAQPVDDSATGITSDVQTATPDVPSSEVKRQPMDEKRPLVAEETGDEAETVVLDEEGQSG